MNSSQSRLRQDESSGSVYILCKLNISDKIDIQLSDMDFIIILTSVSISVKIKFKKKM